MQPINLKDQYGDRYRIGLDEATKGERKLAKDPWYYILPCRYGHIYPHGDGLSVFCNGTRKIEQLKNLPGITAYLVGDGEAILTFPLSEFDAVARIAQPKRRRKLSEKHNAALQASARAHQFKPKATVVSARKRGQEAVSGAR